ncbi:MAG: MRP family ATP-binding protein, partial [Sphingobacteriales bacterium 24-40-4]
MITQEQVYNALRHVEDPDLKKDLVSLNMIEDLKIDGNKLSFSVVLTTPACPMKAMLENACKNAIRHFVSKDVELSINMTSRVTSRPDRTLAGIKNII